jgi:G3E family GTPase
VAAAVRGCRVQRAAGMVDVEAEEAIEGGGKVPVTVLTGFLGAGKTTLLNYILTAEHGYRIAIIENEFGQELGMEATLVVADEAGETVQDQKRLAEFVELPNGCICCSIKDDFLAAMEALVEKRDRFDYILVRPTLACASICPGGMHQDTLGAGSALTVVAAINGGRPWFTHAEAGRDWWA